MIIFVIFVHEKPSNHVFFLDYFPGQLDSVPSIQPDQAPYTRPRIQYPSKIIRMGDSPRSRAQCLRETQQLLNTLDKSHHLQTTKCRANIAGDMSGSNMSNRRVPGRVRVPPLTAVHQEDVRPEDVKKVQEMASAIVGKSRMPPVPTRKELRAHARFLEAYAFQHGQAPQQQK